MNKKRIRILTYSKCKDSNKMPDSWTTDKNDDISRLFKFRYIKITILLK